MSIGFSTLATNRRTDSCAIRATVCFPSIINRQPCARSSLPLKPDQLPFLKRYPYQDEREFRLLYQSKMETLPTFDVSISLDCIEPNNTDPWIATALADDVKETILSIPDCTDLRIARSTSYESNQDRGYRNRRKMGECE